MGISKEFAELIFREHVRKPFDGQSLVVGRQTIIMTPDEAYQLAKQTGMNVDNIEYEQLEVDDETLASSGNSFIKDSSFFDIMGLNDLLSIDVSDYEKASNIFDLNYLTDTTKFENIADLIVDGSTLDNIFDPATGIKNLSKMLKPDGRMLLYNVGSNHNCPYVILTPLWFYDYFVVNKFSSVRVFIIVNAGHGYNVFELEKQEVINKAPRWTPNFVVSEYLVGLIVLAEKDKNSTFDKAPIQHQYRDEQTYNDYVENVQRMKDNEGTEILYSSVDKFVETPSGYKFIEVLK